MAKVWDERYSKKEYHYGKDPNSFLKEELPKLKPGNILFIGEGEGRNAVYAATLGWNVDAIDFSEEGKRKAENLAEEFGVKINYQIKDFSTFTPQEKYYDAVGIFFIHLDEELKSSLFPKLIKSLKPAGIIIFECFEKEQINHNSGGPKDEALLYSLEDVVSEFIDLEFEKLSKEKVFLNEGKGHFGEGVVIRFMGTHE
jgi:2-polyprenyl-3-methyl-5-hydroxy-6-metoxy-1,4-benzoquinol methylase